MIDRTMAASSALRHRCVTKLRSIFTSWTGSRWRYDREE
jgi:hypothetical protein